MLGLPNEPLPGQLITAADQAQAVRYIKSTMHRGAPGQLVTTGSGGTTSRTIRRRGPAAWPTNAAATILPYTVTDASTAMNPQVTVSPGTHNAFMPQIDGSNLIPPVTTPPTPVPVLTLGDAALWVYVQFDLTYDQNGKITILDGSINSANSGGVPSTTVTPVGTGGGSGTFYEAIAAVTVTAPTGDGGSYSVTVYQLVTTIRALYMCGSTIVVTS